jgi:hypothetical protein
MYQKQKMTSTPKVDVEELKRQLRREALGDLRPILEVQGIQFHDISGVMSDKERRSSLASTVRVDDHRGSLRATSNLSLQSSRTCNLILLVRESF